MIQEILQTDDEKMAMYMKLPKKKIIEMLIECNKALSTRYGVSENFAQPVVINTYHSLKICDCNRKFNYTADTICDGRCK